MFNFYCGKFLPKYCYMALFNFSKIEGNDNEVQQGVNKGDGFFMKLLQIIGFVATLIGAIVGVIALIK